MKRAFSYYARTFDEALIINDIKILQNIVLKLSNINCKNKDYVKAAVRCENLLYKNAPYLLKIIVTDNNKITTENQTIINYQF